MAGGFFKRYIRLLEEGCMELIPKWVQAAFFGVPAAQIVYVGSQKPGQRSIPQSVLRGGPTKTRTIVADVVLPSEVLLARKIDAPPKAAGALLEIAKLDLIRKTPFTTSDVDWTLTYKGSRDITQWVAKRTDLASYREALKRQGYLVRKFLIDQDGQSSVLADYTSIIAPRGGFWRRLNAGLSATILALLGYIWIEPAFNAQEIASMEDQISTGLRDDALALRAELTALADADAARTAFLETVVGRPRLIDSLQQLTAALPDGVWLSDLQLDGHQLIAKGQTNASAAALVLQLTEADIPLVPALSGPMSRTNDGYEQFTIVFTRDGGSH